MAVLLFHTVTLFWWPPAWIQWVHWPIVNMAFDGRAAVAMFFVLSGFVLSRPFVSPLSPPIAIGSFYIKRLFRIWLPWFVIFAFSLLAFQFFAHRVTTSPPVNYWFWKHAVSWTDLLKQLAFQFADPGLRLLPQDWSLAVELKGSALIPLFVWIARRPRHLFWFGLLSVTGFFFCLNSGGYYISFILGVILARHQDFFLMSIKKRGGGFQLCFLLTGMAAYEASLAAEWLHLEGWLTDKLSWVVCSLGCFLILISCLSSRRLTRFLNWRPVLLIGQISYSIYLVQFLVLFSILPAVFFWLTHHGVKPQIWMLPFSLILGVVPTLLLSRLTYAWVEIPSIQLGRKGAAHFENYFADRKNKPLTSKAN